MGVSLIWFYAEGCLLSSEVRIPILGLIYLLPLLPATAERTTTHQQEVFFTHLLVVRYAAVLTSTKVRLARIYKNDIATKGVRSR